MKPRLVVRVLWAEDKDNHFSTLSEELQEYLAKRDIRVEFVRARNGDQVYRPLTSNTRPIDVLVTDLDMPIWGGVETVRDVSEKWPGLPIVVVSGYLHDFHSELATLIKRRLLQGAYDLTPTEPWCEKIYALVSSRSPVVLHLSDLHFGSFHAFGKPIRLWELLKSPLSDIAEKEKINLVVVSGDVSSLGTEPEFDEAEEFLRSVSKVLHLPIDRTVVVPGNHDIYRDEEPAFRFGKFVDFLNKLHGEGTLNRYPELYDVHTGRLRRDSHDELPDQLYCIAIFDDLRTVVIGMNSVQCEEARFDEGAISQRQLISIRDQLKGLRMPRSRFKRFGVFHHHLFGIPSIHEGREDERVICGQGLLLRYLLSQNINVVFHGHTHYSVGHEYRAHFIDEDVSKSSTIHAFSAGTLGGSHMAEAQPFFSFSVLRCIPHRTGQPTEGLIKRFRLYQDRLDWVGDTGFRFNL